MFLIVGDIGLLAVFLWTSIPTKIYELPYPYAVTSVQRPEVG